MSISERKADAAYRGVSSLAEWLASPLGSLLQEQERRVVVDALEDVFGLQLLQIGAWGEVGGFLRTARTQRQAEISTSVNRAKAASIAAVCSKPAELAVASDSVDAVLLPHTLEFEGDPYAVLREVERILLAEGKLLILGFNPAGTWALRHRLSPDGFLPGLARLISERRLRDWLALLSFEVMTTKHFLFRLPMARARTEHRWLLPGSAYLLKARKRVYTLTPVRPRWRERRGLVGGLVEPTTRIGA
jgi:SAM-dependent methyltransferase